MKIETLNERIQKAEEKIIKKQNTIAKKTATIQKKEAELAKTNDEQEQRWIKFDIRSLEDDLKRLASEIKETEKTLENYRKQLSGEIERQKSWISEVPEVLKSFQEELTDKWDAYDIKKRDKIRSDRDALSYEDWAKKYHWRDRDWAMYTTDEQIHESNNKDAVSLILNLVNRVKEITGEITNWSGLRTTAGTWGFTVLNG